MVSGPLVLKIIVVVLSVIVLLSQIVALTYACIEKDVLLIIPALLGVAAGTLGIWAGIKENKWVAIVVFFLVLAALIWYSVLWVKSAEQSGVAFPLMLAEKEYKCCGKDGPKYYLSQNKEIPRSCYPEGKEGDMNFLYQKGCNNISHGFSRQTRGGSFFGDVFYIIFSVVFAFLLLILFCIFLIYLWPCVCWPCFAFGVEVRIAASEEAQSKNMGRK